MTELSFSAFDLWLIVHGLLEVFNLILQVDGIPDELALSASSCKEDPADPTASNLEGGSQLWVQILQVGDFLPAQFFP